MYLQATQTVNHAVKNKGYADMTKEDLILEAIKEVREGQIMMGKDVAVLNYVSSSVSQMVEDVAVLKSKHDTGNLSAKISAFCAILALVIAGCVAITSCKDKEYAEKYKTGRKPVDINSLCNGSKHTGRKR